MMRQQKILRLPTKRKLLGFSSGPIVFFIDSNLREGSHKTPSFSPLLATAIFLPSPWKRAQL